MSLYPSLEDMQVDKLVQTQRAMVNELVQSELHGAITAQNTGSQAGGVTGAYPALSNFLGLDLTPEMIRRNMPEYAQEATNTAIQPRTATAGYPSLSQTDGGVVAPVTGNALIPKSAQVTHNIRELILCKGANGKVGLRVQSKDGGVFVCIVSKGSPAALAGLRFGDQILQLNGTLVAGFSVDKIHKMLKQSGKNNISVVVRDRPMERTITLIKDHEGGLGFHFKNGKITSIVKDSTSARNGVLINHNLLEINGQNVVAMKDKDIKKIIAEAPSSAVQITIIPSFIYDHLVEKLSTSFLRGIMDHSIPDF